MPQIHVFAPADVTSQINPAPIGSFNLQLLAQGDSWFSIGQFGIPPTSNLFDGMSTTTQACVVNCAHPGAVLRRMMNTVREQFFLSMLNGKLAQQWGGILLSGGGNDMIDAAQAGPASPANLRLLATPAEWTDAVGGDKYLSNAGWSTFSEHLTAVLSAFLATRDLGPNKGVAVIMHSYDFAVPRNKGAGIGFGPWLYPAMRAFNIPEPDWAATSQALLMRLQVLLDHIAATTPDGSLHIVHTQGTLIPACTSDTGATLDWANEIHPSIHGYQKLSALWQPVLDPVLSGIVAPAPALIAATSSAPTIDQLLSKPASAGSNAPASQLALRTKPDDDAQPADAMS